MALDTSKATDMTKKAVDSIKDKAACAVTPAVAAPAAAPVAAPVPVAATPAAELVATTTDTKTATRPMSHKKHKHGKKSS